MRSYLVDPLVLLFLRRNKRHAVLVARLALHIINARTALEILEPLLELLLLLDLLLLVLGQFLAYK